MCITDKESAKQPEQTPPLSPVSAAVLPDGASDKAGDELGSEDDLYEDFRGSGHRFGHPGGGGGEQLAINEVKSTPAESQSSVKACSL